MDFRYEVVMPNEGLPFRMFIFEGKDGNYRVTKHWHQSVELFLVLLYQNHYKEKFSSLNSTNISCNSLSRIIWSIIFCEAIPISINCTAKPLGKSGF